MSEIPMVLPTEAHTVSVHISRAVWHAFVVTSALLDVPLAEAFEQAIDEVDRFQVQNSAVSRKKPVVVHDVLLTATQIAKLHEACRMAKSSENSVATAAIWGFVARRQEHAPTAGEPRA